MPRKKSKQRRLDRLEPKQQVEVTEYQAEFQSGPLPSPAILSQYDSVLLGAAGRIVSMAEEQAKHRRHLEKVVVESGANNERLGMHYGFLIGISGIIASVALVWNGMTWPGVVIGGADLLSLVGVFIYGRRKQEQERAHKIKVLKN